MNKNTKLLLGLAAVGFLIWWVLRLRAAKTQTVPEGGFMLPPINLDPGEEIIGNDLYRNGQWVRPVIIY